jgi:hypothetical protein
MIRFVLRSLGLWILALGFIVLVYDGTKSIAGDHIFVTSLENLWNAISSASLPVIQQHVSAWLWDQVIRTVLRAPAWLVFAVLGALLMLLGRKKKPVIGYAR